MDSFDWEQAEIAANVLPHQVGEWNSRAAHDSGLVL